ncbi:SulP family inorganic anion transporter [Streptomyces sp. RPT161]|uniref:SulP family inorganic anion transporter n=1 Tax=Streptomyces sp. RPT161 TaxID=3015993 RepID=UPI0022B89EE0|nr:SulP family inorganic anion transporter [Streptomyces sp. RPT161]
MRRSLRRDVRAGALAAVSMLPSVLGLGVASGLGAASAVISAVLGGAIAALLGGVPLQVTAPTGVLVAVLAPVTRTYGPAGSLTVGLLAGFLLIIASLIGASRVVRHMPVSVIQGFTIGGVLVIVLRQLTVILGPSGRHGGPVAFTAARALTAFMTHPHWHTVIVASVTMTVRLVDRRSRLPGLLTAVTIAAVTALTLRLHLALHHIGYGTGGVPLPSVRFLEASSVPALMPSAALLALLVTLESLRAVISTQPINAEDQRLEDRELFGQGVANLTAPLFGGIAATGSAARTAVNVRAGATSRVASLVGCSTLALISLTAAPLIAQIPRVALSGVVIATMVRSIDVKALLTLARVDRSQTVVVAVTAATPLVFNFAIALAAGSALAASLALRQIARTAHVELVPAPGRPVFFESLPVRWNPSAGLPEEQTDRFSLEGALFFATADRLLRPVRRSPARLIILDMSRVTSVDATALMALRAVVDAFARRGTHVLLRGVGPDYTKAVRAVGLANEARASKHPVADTGGTEACPPVGPPGPRKPADGCPVQDRQAPGFRRR